MTLQVRQPRQSSQTVSNALCNKNSFGDVELATYCTDEIRVKQIFYISSVQVHFATQAVLDKLPQRPPSSQLSGSLFLQLTVDHLGVCIPLYNGNQVCKIKPHSHGRLLPPTVISLRRYTSVFCAEYLRIHRRGPPSKRRQTWTLQNC